MISGESISLRVQQKTWRSGDLNAVSVTKPLANLHFSFDTRRVHCSKDTVKHQRHPVALWLLSSQSQMMTKNGLKTLVTSSMSLTFKPAGQFARNVSFPAWSQTEGTRANTRQRNAYRIKCECRDNWTSRGALDSIQCPYCKTQATTNDAGTQTDGSSHQRTVKRKIICTLFIWHARRMYIEAWVV